MCFAVLAPVTATMNSTLVELSVVSNCVLDPHTIAPPECVNACPVVDHLLLRLFAHAASMKPISLPCVMGSGCCLSNGCMTSGGFDDSASLLQTVKQTSFPSALLLKDVSRCSSDKHNDMQTGLKQTLTEM